MQTFSPIDAPRKSVASVVLHFWARKLIGVATIFMGYLWYGVFS